MRIHSTLLRLVLASIFAVACVLQSEAGFLLPAKKSDKTEKTASSAPKKKVDKKSFEYKVARKIHSWKNGGKKNKTTTAKATLSNSSKRKVVRTSGGSKGSNNWSALVKSGNKNKSANTGTLTRRTVTAKAQPRKSSSAPKKSSAPVYNSYNANFTPTGEPLKVIYVGGNKTKDANTTDFSNNGEPLKVTYVEGGDPCGDISGESAIGKTYIQRPDGSRYIPSAAGASVSNSRSSLHRHSSTASRQCRRCGGSGTCTVCAGTKKTINRMYGSNYRGSCGNCHGTGDCPACGGTGHY